MAESTTGDGTRIRYKCWGGADPARDSHPLPRSRLNGIRASPGSRTAGTHDLGGEPATPSTNQTIFSMVA